MIWGKILLLVVSFGAALAYGKLYICSYIDHFLANYGNIFIEFYLCFKYLI